MPATLTHRRRLVELGLTLFATALGAMLFLEVPGIGIAYFLYIPIALVALATSALSGAAAGIVAAEIYAIGELHGAVPQPDVLTTTSALRLLTYALVGALIGKFADDQRLFTRRLRSLAERDELTGLLNARAHRNLVAQRVAAGSPFALLLVDLDDLKAVNDARGHAAGNETLVRLATALAGAVRREDSVARIGGDEFALLVRDAGAREASTLCHRLEEILAAGDISASFGWAAWPDDGRDAAALFQRADERLYERKADRRGAREERWGAEIPADFLG